MDHLANALASHELPCALNRGVGISDAINAAYPSWKATQRLPALETIIPLNRKAVTALAVAYTEFGSWRDEDELIARGAFAARAA